MRPTARGLALELILAAREGSDVTNLPAVEALTPEDRGLYKELTQGGMREALFLDAVLRELCKKPPGRKLSALIELSAYQLLFLDRVPAFAVFSEMKKMAEELKFSVQETKFAHGVLKSMERRRDEFLKRRADVLKSIESGASPQGDFERAVLNCPKELYNELGSLHAPKALAAMKRRPSKVGFEVPGRKGTAVPTPISKALSKRARSWEGLESPELAGLAAQADVSIHACDLAAEQIRALAAGGRPVRVLEMATGKGTKLLSTLCALGSDVSVEWTAVDASSRQLQTLKDDVAPVVQKEFPHVKLDVVQKEWRKSVAGDSFRRVFDFVWLDAPCSGFGTLAKLPQIALARGAEAHKAVRELSKLQTVLAEEGTKLLEPKGIFFYSVCTMTELETVGIRQHIESLGLRKVEEETFWPGHEPAPDSEGFYLAFMKTSSAP